MLNHSWLVVVDFGEPLSDADARKYRSMIGMLFFDANCLRQGIRFTGGLLSRFLSKAHRIYFSCSKRILLYFSGSQLGFYYGSAPSVNIFGYTYCDWAVAVGDRKSIGGYTFTINGTPVTWSSKKQTSVAVPKYEAEYVALTEVVEKSMFLNVLFKYIASEVNTPCIHCDNSSAINLAKK